MEQCSAEKETIIKRHWSPSPHPDVSLFTPPLAKADCIHWKPTRQGFSRKKTSLITHSISIFDRHVQCTQNNHLSINCMHLPLLVCTLNILRTQCFGPWLIFSSLVEMSVRTFHESQARIYTSQGTLALQWRYIWHCYILISMAQPSYYYIPSSMMAATMLPNVLLYLGLSKKEGLTRYFLTHKIVVFLLLLFFLTHHDPL